MKRERTRVVKLIWVKSAQSYNLDKLQNKNLTEAGRCRRGAEIDSSSFSLASCDKETGDPQLTRQFRFILGAQENKKRCRARKNCSPAKIGQSLYVLSKFALCQVVPLRFLREKSQVTGGSNKGTKGLHYSRVFNCDADFSFKLSILCLCSAGCATGVRGLRLLDGFIFYLMPMSILWLQILAKSGSRDELQMVNAVAMRYSM